MHLNTLSAILSKWRSCLSMRPDGWWSLTIKKFKTFFTWTSRNISIKISVFFWNWTLPHSILMVTRFYIRDTKWFFSFLQRDFWINFLYYLVLFLKILNFIRLYYLILFYILKTEIKISLLFNTYRIITNSWCLSLLFLKLEKSTLKCTWLNKVCIGFNNKCWFFILFFLLVNLRFWLHIFENLH